MSTSGAQAGHPPRVFCVGCCWSLMLLMFAVGVGNIGWMLMLGAVMAVEKNMPWGRQLSAPLGVVLVVREVSSYAGGASARTTGLLSDDTPEDQRRFRRSGTGRSRRTRGFSREEIQLGLRNHGMPLEGLRYRRSRRRACTTCSCTSTSRRWTRRLAARGRRYGRAAADADAGRYLRPPAVRCPSRWSARATGGR